MALFLVMAS